MYIKRNPVDCTSKAYPQPLWLYVSCFAIIFRETQWYACTSKAYPQLLWPHLACLEIYIQRNLVVWTSKAFLQPLWPIDHGKISDTPHLKVWSLTDNIILSKYSSSYSSAFKQSWYFVYTVQNNLFRIYHRICIYMNYHKCL